MCHGSQGQCHQEAGLYYEPGLLAGSPKVECSLLRQLMKMHPALFRINSPISRKECMVPVSMGVEKLMKRSYWIATVVEGDAGRGPFTDKDSDIQTNLL